MYLFSQPVKWVCQSFLLLFSLLGTKDNHEEGIGKSFFFLNTSWNYVKTRFFKPSFKAETQKKTYDFQGTVLNFDIRDWWPIWNEFVFFFNTLRNNPNNPKSYPDWLAS